MTMRRSTLHRHRAGLLFLALVLPGAPAFAQDDGRPPEGTDSAQSAEAAAQAADAAAMGAVEIMDAALNDRDPAKIKPVFTTLDEQWANLSPKTIKRVNKSISGMFAKLKPRESRDIDTLGEDAKNGRFDPEEGSRRLATDTQKQDVLDCYHSAIGLLYDKPDGPAVLLPVLKLQHVKVWPDVQVLVLEGLGYRGEGALEKEFEGYLRHENPAVASAAASAMGHLQDQPMDVRRRAVTALVDAFSAAQKASDKEASKVGEDDERPARRYYSSVMLAFREALTSLTRQSFDKPPEWREWLDAHGKDASW